MRYESKVGVLLVGHGEIEFAEACADRLEDELIDFRAVKSLQKKKKQTQELCKNSILFIIVRSKKHTTTERETFGMNWKPS